MHQPRDVVKMRLFLQQGSKQFDPEGI